MPTNTEILDLLSKHKPRQIIERALVLCIVEDAIKAGYSLTVESLDGDEEAPEIAKSKDADAILKAMFQGDEDRVTIYDDTLRLGWLFFVYGNDGWDVLSDYSANQVTEAVVKRAMTYAMEN